MNLCKINPWNFVKFITYDSSTWLAKDEWTEKNETTRKKYICAKTTSRVLRIIKE